MSSEQEENSCEAGAISETTENAEQQPEVIENETQKRKGIATDEDSIHYTPAEKIIQIILSLMLVVTGSVNTLAAKWADEVNIHGTYFDHPFFQATVMFVGEITCLLAYFIHVFTMRMYWKLKHPGQEIGPLFRDLYSSNSSSSGDEAYIDSDGNAYRKDSTVSVESGSQRMRNGSAPENNNDNDDNLSEVAAIPRFNYFLFAAPAFCDVLATSIQYVGLTLTSASSYQMLRGAVIIFTGIFSMMCLRLRLRLFHWTGMFLVVLGLVIVGVADILYANDTAEKSRVSIITGDVIIILSQIIVAIQMVLEQKLLADCDCPALLAVGIEGCTGFVILSILMIPMYYIHVPAMFSASPEHRLEDALDAFREIGESGELTGALCLTIVSIAFFNFAGISVTKYMNATTRMVLDSVRTIVIWAVSIPIFHENFIPLQILGFVCLAFGMFIYNDVLFGPWLRTTRCGAKFYPASMTAGTT